MEATADRPSAEAAETTAPAAPPAASAVPPGAASPPPELPPVVAAEGFADLEPLRAAWDRAAADVPHGLLAGFDAARARCRNDAAVTDGGAARLVTAVPAADDDGLAAAIPWTLERLRGPLAWMRLAATAGAPTGVLPAPILVRGAADAPGTAAAASAWLSILATLDERARPDAVEIGPVPMDGAAWAGLVQALAQTGGRVRLARAWTSGLWTVLPTEPDAARWRERIERERHRLRRSSGPERITALESVADVRMALHETDRLLRRSRGGDGLDVVPGGRHLVESLVRSSGPDAPVQPLALRLEAAGRAIGRAVALVRGERAVVLAVACDRSLPERRFAPGRLVFAGLIDALVERGVRAVDAGPGAAWFAERTDGGAVVPMRTCLLVPRDPRRVPFEAMTDFVGRLPSLGPFERFVARLRPWAEIDAED